MARPSKLTPEQWEQVRSAMIAGVDSKRLAFEFGISASTIRDRAMNEKWPIPNRVKEITEEYQKSKQELSNGIPTVSDKGGKSALQVVGETLQEKAEAYGLIVFNKTSEAVKKALDQGLPTPDNWKTLAIADQMARRAAGLDKPQTQVNIALGGIFRSPDQSGVIIESESPEEPEQES